MSASEYLEERARSTINPAELLGLMALKPDRFVLVDVRNGPVASTIRGAIRIPAHEIAARMEELPREMLIVLYSRNNDCLLAIKAVVSLLDAGFDAKELNRGIDVWIFYKMPLQ